ncbi:MAG: hypothetical protein MI924_14275 [Chloroflexales bacterium]|nr:hypothetical protein [Chloroflexales bacterium]
MDGIEQQYGDRLEVVRLDFNSPRGQDLATTYRVRGHPTIVLLDRAGAVQATIFGIPNPSSLEEAVQAILSDE